MLFSLDFQLVLLFFNVLSGLFLGLTYDIFKSLEKHNGTNKFINIFEWILYFIFITISYFIAHIYFVKAFLSWYTIIVCILSFVLYMKIISKYLRTIIFYLTDNISIILSIISKYIKLPFYLIKVIIKKVL